MANSSNSNHVTEFPPMSSPPPTPSASIPLHLCGVLTGDTVQVQGDTGELQFSVQFKVHRKEHHQSNFPCNFSDANIPDIGTFHDSVQTSPPSSSSYLTPTCTRENQDHTADADADALGEESLSRGAVVTRLRSGVLSPVKYYPNGVCYGGVFRGSLSSQKKRKVKRARGGKAEYVFDKMLRRRSFPLKPCSSYAFFLTANWGVVKRCSFAETSKRLSKQWYKLPHDIKKEYEEMALKDNARYKRQCMLLKNDSDQQESSSSGLLVDSN